ncbi:MAG: HDOD domain-containing protein [Sulfurimonadaceae bacterium]|nr:HDOD domain-containing protein [Sulfurimonadaceae bacterium]
MAWLQRVAEQFETWSDDLLIGSSELSPLDADILGLLQLKQQRRHPKEVLAPLSLLVVSTNDVLLENIRKGVKPFVKTIHTAATFDEAQRVYFDHYPDIVLCDFALDDGHTALKLFQKINTEEEALPFLTLLAPEQKRYLRKLALYGLRGLSKPINLKKLVYELIETAQLYFGEQHIRIHSKSIQKQIDSIQPLPGSLQKVIDLCDNDETDVKQIVYAVKDDPILTALVIKEANSPLYNQNAKSVEQAVSFFGKRIVKALTLSLSTQLLEPIELKCYASTAEKFKNVSNMRLALAMMWYSKVDIKALSTLASAAAISNLGQIIIARELVERNACGTLHTLMHEHTVNDAEEQLLGTTTPEVTADILKHWNFDQITVDTVRYAHAPQYAPPEARPLAMANHIISKIVPLNATEFPARLSEALLILMQQEGLDPLPLEKALERLAR